MIQTRVLITGGGGYLGTTCVRRLYYKPVVFDNLMYDQGPVVYNAFRANDIKFYNENVLDWSDNLKNEIKKADVIIPLSAFVGQPICDQYPLLSHATNYEWFEQLVKIIGKEQLILAPNTNSQYGKVEGIATEETPINPLSQYAKSKQKMEELLLHEHKNTIVFRLATVFGWSPRPRLDLLINSLAYEAYTNKQIKVFDGNNSRNYIHVTDVARAFNFAIEKSNEMIGQVFNLGNDKLNCTKNELANQIAEITQVPVIEDKSKTDPDKRDYKVSSAKLYNLGFECKTGLKEGVKELLNFFPFITDPKAKFLRNY